MPLDPLTTARLLAAGRTLIGISALLMPRTVGKGFVGSLVDAPGGTAAVRTIGIRDLALGAGALIADRRGKPRRGWVEAGVLVDLVDCFVALFAGRGVPFASRAAVVLLGSAAAVAGVAASTSLDASEEGATQALPTPRETR